MSRVLLLVRALATGGALICAVCPVAEFVAMLRDRDTSSTSSHFNRTFAQLSQQSVALRRQATELHT